MSHIDLTMFRPVVSDSDIKFRQVAAEFEYQGMTSDQTVDVHPHLLLASVHAALAFFDCEWEATQDECRRTGMLIRELRVLKPSRRTGS